MRTQLLPWKGAQQPPTFPPTLLWHGCPSQQQLSFCKNGCPKTEHTQTHTSVEYMSWAAISEITDKVPYNWTYRHIWNSNLFDKAYSEHKHKHYIPHLLATYDAVYDQQTCNCDANHCLHQLLNKTTNNINKFNNDTVFLGRIAL